MTTSPLKSAALLCAAMLSVPAHTAVGQQGIDLAKLQTEAVQRTREYLRINTTNPPGNEVETMRWFARILQQEGIPFDTASSAPGRGNIWARLKGGNQPALVLLHHMDVVPADPKYWNSDPFAATTKDSVIFGRGALDTKTLGVVELEAFLALHRAKVPLDRDVIFMATADEEAGGNFGAGWMVKNRPDAFKGAGILLNEGGEGTAGRRWESAVRHRGHTEDAVLAQAHVVGNPGPRIDASAGVRGQSPDSRARSVADI
jgi:acetylornithine deacetylase/succinyl-diaminopimelate desuccinylase-like protein